MTRAAGAIDLPIRVGVHTGEVEFVGDDVRGKAVHTTARILGLAGPNEVLLSSATADLVDSPDLIVEDAGLHELKGLTGARQVFRLVERPAG
jgi:class 3 adenylate cyclase